jgi:folate-dependent phosphoribosylglycinamide formyltransferase PurN
VKITILTRFPRVDTLAWKRDLATRLAEAGVELSVVYTRSALRDQVRGGLREYGFDVLQKYKDLRATPRATADTRDSGETLAAWAEQHSFRVCRFRTLRDPQCVKSLRRLEPDLIILAGADIVPAPVLEVPRLGTINPHYALLPRYRGMNVAEWSVYLDARVGLTVHCVDTGIDTGDILKRDHIPVEQGDTLETIRGKQQQRSAELLFEAAVEIGEGRCMRVPQAAGEGRQYYRMHPALRARAEEKLATGRYRWLGVPLERGSFVAV